MGLEQPPIDDRLVEFALPQVKEQTLSNGLQLVVFERKEIPKVYFKFGIEFGSKYDPAARKGAVELLARTLKKGTANRSYIEIANLIDSSGGMLDAGFSNDFFHLYGEFLSDHLDLAMDLMRELIIEPVFDEAELIKEQEKMTNDLQNERSSPTLLAHKQFDREIYSPHPYSRFKDDASIRSLDRRIIQDLHKQYFQPKRSVLVVSGDVRFEDILGRVERLFSTWANDVEPPFDLAAPRGPQRQQLHLIDRPDSEQVNLLLGNQIFRRDHPLHETAVVANKILGGGSSGRLFMKLREEKGFTYGSYSTLDLAQDSGAWVANAEVRPDVVGEALRAFFAEFHKLRNEPVSEDELRKAKRYLLGIFPLRNETAASIATLALWQRLYKFPQAYWDSYLRRIDRTSAEDIRKLAVKYLIPESMTIVMVGDANTLQGQLGDFQDICVYDQDGNRK